MEQIRKKHNEIKFQLIQESINKLRMFDKSRKICLLDLGIGRANDIHKWKNLNIDNIIGIDSDENQLKEAKKRINNYNVTLFLIDLSSKDINNKLDVIKNYKFDIINSFFSLHYFINNISIILSNIKLHDDAIFNITFMNIKDNIIYLKNSLENNLIYINKLDGNKIDVKFKDTPYFSLQSFPEYTLGSFNIIKLLSKIFKNYTYKNFLEYYSNIIDLTEDELITELMHSSLTFYNEK
jgi:hypothetical protein